MRSISLALMLALLPNAYIHHRSNADDDAEHGQLARLVEHRAKRTRMILAMFIYLLFIVVIIISDWR